MHHGLGVIAQHVEGKGHVARRERDAVRPFNARANLYGEYGKAVIVLPTLGQPVLVFPSEHIVHNQRLKHRWQRTHVESLIGTGDVGILVVE